MSSTMAGSFLDDCFTMVLQLLILGACPFSSCSKLDPLGRIIVGNFRCLYKLDFPVNLFPALAKALLQAAEQFLFLAFGECEIVVRELRILLFELSFYFVPVAFDLKFIHFVKFACRAILRMLPTWDMTTSKGLFGPVCHRLEKKDRQIRELSQLTSRVTMVTLASAGFGSKP